MVCVYDIVCVRACMVCVCVCMHIRIHKWVYVCLNTVLMLLMCLPLARAVNILYSITTVSPSYRSQPDNSAY